MKVCLYDRPFLIYSYEKFQNLAIKEEGYRLVIHSYTVASLLMNT